MSNSDPMNAPYKGMVAYPVRHFGWPEVACKHCGGFPERSMLQSFPFLLIAQIAFAVRAEIGRPLTVSSWYRCPLHPIEARKPRPGVHQFACAVDVLVNRWDVVHAINATCRVVQREGLIDWEHLPKGSRCDEPTDILGIGIRQSGDMRTRFVHIDVAGLLPEFHPFRPGVWTY